MTVRDAAAIETSPVPWCHRWLGTARRVVQQCLACCTVVRRSSDPRTSGSPRAKTGSPGAANSQTGEVT